MMGSSSEECNRLYAKVLSRLSGDAQENKETLDRLLSLNFQCAEHNRRRSMELARSFGAQAKKGRPVKITLGEDFLLLDEVNILRGSKRLSISKALEHIHKRLLTQHGKSQLRNRAETARWVKTKANRLSALTAALRGANKMFPTQNIE